MTNREVIVSPVTPADLAGMRGIASLPPHLLVPHYLIHSCLYYHLDHSIISDQEFDELSSRLHAEWDRVEHVHKNLIDRDALKTTGSYIKFPLRVIGCAQMFKDATSTTYLSPSEKAMAINARSKGQRGEREIIDLLQYHINEVSAYNQVEAPFLQRNQMQSHQGGYDIVGLPGFAFEVKRVEQHTPGNVAKWWKQTCGQAKAGEEPVLFHRVNKKPWSVKLFTRLDLPNGQRFKVPATISMDDFILYLKAKLHRLQLAEKASIDKAANHQQGSATDG